MLTPTSALLWETRRILRWRIWVAFSILMLFPAMTLFVMGMEALRGASLTQPSQWEAGTQMVLTMTNLMFCLMMIGHGIGMPVRQFTLPVSTRTLATLRLLPGALCCAGLYLVLASTLNIVFAAGWPCFGPAMTYGVGFMVMYAAIYPYRGNDTRMGIAGVLMGTVLLFWVGGHYATRWWSFDEVKHLWADLTATEFVILLAAAAAAWATMVQAIERDRRGAGWGRVKPVSEASPSAATQRTAATRRFSSPVTALFWQEWKQDGWLLPGVIGALTFVVGAIYTGGLIYDFSRNPTSGSHARDDLLIIIVSILPICAVAPWFLGLSGAHGKRVVTQRMWQTSQTSLPLSDTALGWVVFARMIASGLMSAALMIGIGTAWYFVQLLVFKIYGVTIEYNDASYSLWMGANWYYVTAFRYIATLLLILWLTSGFSVSATLTGRWWLASLPIGLIPAWILLTCFAAIEGGFNGGRNTQMIFDGAMLLMLCTLVVGTLVAYVIGLTRNILTARTFVLGCVLLVTVECIGHSLINLNTMQATVSNVPPLHPAAVQALTLLFALAAAPPALIPLATYYNRHR